MPFHTQAARSSKRGGSVTTPPGANIARPDLSALARQQGVQGLQIPGVNAPAVPGINRQLLLLQFAQGAAQAAQPQLVDIGGGFRARVQPSFTQALLGGGRAAAQAQIGQLQQQQQFRRKETAAEKRFAEQRLLQTERLEVQQDLAADRIQASAEAAELREKAISGRLRQELEARTLDLQTRLFDADRELRVRGKQKINEIIERQGLIATRTRAQAARKHKEKIADLKLEANVAKRVLRISRKFSNFYSIKGKFIVMEADHLRLVVNMIRGEHTDAEVEAALGITKEKRLGEKKTPTLKQQEEFFFGAP